LLAIRNCPRARALKRQGQSAGKNRKGHGFRVHAPLFMTDELASLTKRVKGQSKNIRNHQKIADSLWPSPELLVSKQVAVQ
jgi:hypothetical protein